MVGADGTQYVWGTEHYGRYIQLYDVSFDGGATWTDAFPTVIPLDTEDGIMLIRAAYRLAEKSDWTNVTVSYLLEESRVFVLSRPLRSNESVIDPSLILNGDPMFQHYAAGSVLNLYRQQTDLLGYGYLDGVFSGWLENGEPVSWDYIITPGRHILEPAAAVPVSDEYKIALKPYWMNGGSLDGQLCYFQTLVDYNGATGDSVCLEVPEYVQAVSFSADSNVEIGSVYIPDTVISIDTVNSGLRVHKGYSVSADNPVFCAESGVLVNKEKTEIIGIPLDFTWLDIPDSVTSMNLPADNELIWINLQAETVNELPEINLDNLSADCSLIICDSVWLDYLVQAEYNGFQIYVTPASEADNGEAYTLINSFVISRDGAVKTSVGADEASSVYLPDGASLVMSGALDSLKNANVLIMPGDGGAANFESGCFEDCGIKTVLCYTKTHYESARRDVPDDIAVMLMDTSAEGYFYYYSEDVFSSQCVLVSAPDEATEFFGYITAGSGERIPVDVIGEGAFAECKYLKWVTLYEDEAYIEKNAFKDCTALQGVLVESGGYLYIGDGAFKGCSALRFIASNAFCCYIYDGYDLQLGDNYSVYNTYLFAPTGCIGYSANWISFTPESGVCRFGVEKLGDTGRMLYGYNECGMPWLALRSGEEMDPVTVMPYSTDEVWDYAMADTYCDTGTFTVDWSGVYQLALHDGVFTNSRIGPDMVLPPQLYYLGSSIFKDCRELVNITFGELTVGATLYSGLFTGCDDIRTITLTNVVSPDAAIEDGFGFRFNYEWSQSQESCFIRLIVPDFCEVSYIKNWRCLMAGFGGTDSETAYQRMWKSIRMKHCDLNTLEYPSDEEVDVYLEQELIETENALRQMLGADSVEYPTELYHYRVSGDGYITLVSAPPDTEMAFLFDDDIGLKSGWTLDYIASGAFSKCKNLNYVFLPFGLLGISDGAFEGVESESITIMCADDSAPDLTGFEPGTPFSFGVVDSRIHLMFWGDSQTYAESWLFPMAGYTDMAQMRRMVGSELSAVYGREPSVDEISSEIEMRLDAANARLTLMMGLSEAEDLFVPESVEYARSCGRVRPIAARPVAAIQENSNEYYREDRQA